MDRVYALPQFPPNHVTIEKQERVEGLVLSGSRDMSIHSQMSQESLDLGLPHFEGVFLIMKEHEPLGPRDVALFGSDRVMSHANSISHLLQ